MNKKTITFTRTVEVEVPEGATNEETIQVATNQLNGEIERGEFFISDMDAEVE
jgi:hypothetical protein